MGILKKGNYDSLKISDLNFSILDLEEDKNLENLKLDKEEFLAIKEEGREQGYKEGYKKGHSEGYLAGYNLGIEKANEEKEAILSLIEQDRLDAERFLKKEGVKYLNTFKSDIYSLISNSINKIFLNSISNDAKMKDYLETLLSYLKETVKEFSVLLNSVSYDLLSKYIEENNINYLLENSLENYDIIVKTSKETREYFLKDEFLKIQELFKQE